MYRNDSCHGLHRPRQQQQQQLEESQAQVERRHQGRTVVWRWVPFVVHSGAADVISPPLPATSSQSQPRVIYATAKRTENTDPDNLPPLLTGGELREAREVLIRNKVDYLVASGTPAQSALALCIPEVPTMLPRHVNLAHQPLMNDNPQHHTHR